MKLKKAHKNYMNAHRNPRSFINSKATLEDVEELKRLIEEHKTDLSQK